jgi:hypothetical protein
MAHLAVAERKTVDGGTVAKTQHRRSFPFHQHLQPIFTKSIVDLAMEGWAPNPEFNR